MTKNILVCVDAPDPDNAVLILATRRLYPEADVHVLLTGRPINFKATKETQLWDYDLDASRTGQKLAAAHFHNFLAKCGVHNIAIYDGGIAPRTLVPHHIHFKDYFGFLDVDPVAALHTEDVRIGQEKLIQLLMAAGSFSVVVGGPMTGLTNLLEHCPSLAPMIEGIYAMYATWGQVALMQMGDQPRGAVQFNVACDPVAAHMILSGVNCPVYIMPSEVTRVAEIGFNDPEALVAALPSTPGAVEIVRIYRIWYEAAVKPRKGEIIYIHDFVAVLALDPVLREQIYNMVPVEIARVPHLPKEVADWGKVLMAQTANETNRFAATSLTPDGARIYLETLAKIFA